MKKVLIGMLVVLLSFTATACKGGGNKPKPGQTISPTKTQLYVLNYDGGYGTAWLEDIKLRFEAEYADAEIEAGKKGVEIIIDADKDGYYGVDLYNKIGINYNEVFFSESIYCNDYISSNYLLDITDALTEENFDGKAIESKFSKEQKDYLKVGGSYYAVPHYAGFAGIIYDMDVFNHNSLYYAKNGTPSEENYTGTVAYTNFAGVRSAGPDGEYGTSDDGLPATYDEFFALCGYMKAVKGITPFCWTGQYNTTYMKWILASLAASYEGREQMMLNFDFNGTAKNLITVNSSNAIVFDAEDTVITNSNGYEIYRQAGRYYALSFLQRILDNNYYDSCGFDDGCSHVSAQTKYLRSTYNGESIAMLLEGIWWENEAKDIFDRMVRMYGDEYSSKNRNFGFMSLPKVDAEHIGDKPAIIDTNYSYAFIKKNIASYKIDLAKTFIKFCYTDTSLRDFTRIVGLPKAIRYDIEGEFDWKSTFSNSVWSLYSSSDVVFPSSQNSIYLSAQSSFNYSQTFNTASENSALEALHNGVSAVNFFKGIVSLNSKTRWESSYSRYF